MKPLPKNLYTAEQVRKLDRTAIDESGIPGMTLMERAGQAVFTVLRTRWPGVRRIAVMCGAGNNGGDGFVIARLAAIAGIRVVIYQVGDHSRIQGDALTARDRLEGTSVEIHAFDAGQTLALFDVVIDCMLGTGLSGDVRQDWREAIDAVNYARLDPSSSLGKVVAVDIPSGLLANTGAIAGTAIRADITVTFIGMKQGLLTADGPDCCGEIIFTDLDVPPQAYTQISASSQRLRLDDLLHALQPRKRNSHKGQFGHVLVVGGNTGMSGAAQMAAQAAARTGAGMISVATRAVHAGYINITCPELMCHATEDRQTLSHLLQRASVVIVGPGLGQDDWSRTMLNAVLESDLPMVVDADALTLLAQEPVQSERWILTPHPGEAARLLGCSAAVIQRDRFSAAAQLHKRYGGVCVLKGSGTIVVTGDRIASVCDQGNPGMATAGMGDMLSGVIAGLLAQGLSLSASAELGVGLHAAAGDAAARDGERGLMATDLLPQLKTLVNPQ